MVEFTQDQLDVIKRTVEKWSDSKAAKRASEELLELALSLLHADRGKASDEDVKNEMADVRIALQHLEFRYGDYQQQLDAKVIKGNGS